MTEQNVWVEVAFADGDEYWAIAGFPIEEMAEYLSKWDYGIETDYAYAHEYEDGRLPWGATDRTYEVVSACGVDYVLVVDPCMGCALYRRPIA